MKSTFLQVVFSFFLGLAVVAFVGVGVNTFYQQPTMDTTVANPDTGPLDHWRLITSILLVVLATLVMALSLIRSERRVVISNGLMLGGLFTMVYGVGMTMSAQHSWIRLLVVALALAVTIGLGWLTFVLGRGVAPQTGAATVATGTPSDAGDLTHRVNALEAKLDALGRALRNE